LPNERALCASEKKKRTRHLKHRVGPEPDKGDVSYHLKTKNRIISKGALKPRRKTRLSITSEFCSPKEEIGGRFVYS